MRLPTKIVNAATRMRWAIAIAAFRLARIVVVKNCDHGDRMCVAVDRFFFYTSHGYEKPRGGL